MKPEQRDEATSLMRTLSGLADINLTLDDFRASVPVVTPNNALSDCSYIVFLRSCVRSIRSCPTTIKDAFTMIQVV